MARFKLNSPFVGLAIVLLLSSLFARNVLVDDFSGGTNMNYLDGYWFYYDDNARIGSEERPQAAPASTPSIINVPYFLQPRHARGNNNDTFRIKDYQFLIKEEAGNKFGTMPFTFGEKWKLPLYTAEPYVGISTQLAADGHFIDLAGVKSVSFKIRPHAFDLTVRFIIETMEIVSDSTFAFFQKTITPLKGKWSEFNISLDSLEQPMWTPAVGIRPVNWRQTTALTWEVDKIDNESVVSDTLDLDSIVIREDLTSLSDNSCGKLKTGQLGRDIMSCRTTLIDIQGKTIMTSRILPNRDLKLKLLGRTIPNGFYVIEVSGIGSNGRQVSFRSKIAIVR
jgi:hypothetical protein